MLVDTNVWLLVFNSGFPLIELIAERVPQGRIGVPATVGDELDQLVQRRVANALAARTLAARYPVLRHSGIGDEGILRAARLHRALVVTADRELAARLHDAGVTVLIPRDRVRLEIRRGGPPPARRRRASPARTI